MNTNVPIAAAFTLLVVLFIFSCTNTAPTKVDERDLRDYPTGKSYEKKIAEPVSSEQQ